MTFSIGDVLEQLSDDFPDITVSKIRFLESQGLIAPMRTASGFRMFSDTDITKLKWILLHQRDRFLPLKVIKEYLASLTDAAFENGNLPNFDFEGSGALELEEPEKPEPAAPIVDISQRSHLSAVPDREATGQHKVVNLSELEKIEEEAEKLAESTPQSSPEPRTPQTKSSPRATLLQEAPPKTAISTSTAARMKRMSVAPRTYDSLLAGLDADSLVGSTEEMSSPKSKSSKKSPQDAVLSLEAMTIETGISGPTLKELVRFGVLDATGVGNAIVFARDEVSLANVIAPLLDQGLEARHLKTYALFASRESGFLEHVVQDDLRKRNPEARAAAQEKAKKFIQDTARVKEMLLLRAVKREGNPSS